MFDINKDLKNLGLNIYNNKLTAVEGQELSKEEKELREICNKTFGHGTPSPENLHLFNQFLITTVEEIAKPKVDYILGLMADFKSVPAGTVQVYKMPKTVEPKLLYTAKGTGVDLVRIAGHETVKPAVPQSLTYGGYYEITTFMADPVAAFKEAVDNLVQAKLDFYFERVFAVMNAAIASKDIPQANTVTGSNISMEQFQKIENTMIRLTGGRPIFVADIALINHLSAKNNAAWVTNHLLTDEMKRSLRDDLVPSQISKSIALPFPNNYIDEANSKVRFNIQQGFVFPGNAPGKKPFVITEFGAKRQYSEVDPELEQVKLKVVFEADITLLNGRYIGSITESTKLTA